MKLLTKISAKFRKSVSEYTSKDIISLFNGKYNCKDCPFLFIYKGTIPFGCGSYHRFYCSFNYCFTKYLPYITGISPDKLAPEIHKIENNTSMIDIVRKYPMTNRFNKKMFAVSVLFLKENDLCCVDQHNQGLNAFDPVTEAMVRKYREEHGLPNPPLLKS